MSHAFIDRLLLELNVLRDSMYGRGDLEGG
jgi:hypothetical protein